jgi:sugar/nucleoside kinase (ribokinase family)
VSAVDRFPPPDSKVTASSFDAMPGGQAATAAVTCARLGWRTLYVGCVGTDAWGEAVASNLDRERVSHSLIRRSGVPSRIATILVERGTGRRTIIEHRDARLIMCADDVVVGSITSGRVLLVDATSPDASIAAARVARAAGIPTVVDVDRMAPGVGELLAEVDVLIVPASFACDFTGTKDPGQAVRKLAERFQPAAKILTMGSEGSLAVCGTCEIRTPAAPVPVIDTTGAGDAFRGGFISAWLERGPEADLAFLLQFANATGALNCRAMGAQGGLPNRELVDALVTSAYRAQSK